MTTIDHTSFGIAPEWLASLGLLTAGTMTAEDAKAKCVAYVSMIFEQFEAWAFTKVSLEAVARQCKWFPSYAELVEHLGAWCRENRPRVLAIAGPGSEYVMQPSDWGWVRYWDNRKAAGFSNIANCPKYPGVPDHPQAHREAHATSLVRSKSPAAWDHIQRRAA
jgi:hypothetical protein